jgi:hypothetical protein
MSNTRLPSSANDKKPMSKAVRESERPLKSALFGELSRCFVRDSEASFLRTERDDLRQCSFVAQLALLAI